MVDLVSELTTKVRLSTIDCCGFAGDKGFNTPELSRSALSNIKDLSKGCSSGVSTSLPCEIGLSESSGIKFDSLFHLINNVAQPSASKNFQSIADNKHKEVRINLTFS